MKKGFTLVEVLVALSIFVLVFVVVLSTYLLSIRGYEKQLEYLYFENICMDIDQYYDTYGLDWEENYFNENLSTVYYDAEYKVSTTANKYTMKIWYNEANELYISIYNEDKDYFVIADLYYGGSKHENE